jgi:hypothetical protein
MSRLSEYLALVPRGIKNLPQILEAVTNQVKMEMGALPKEKQDIIVGRRLICATCPYMSRKTDRDDDHCIWCGCPIASRTASLEMNCGIQNYNFENKADIPLKWKEEKIYFKNFLLKKK